MNICALQHASYFGPGRIEHWAEDCGHDLACPALHEGAALPDTDDVDFVIVLGSTASVYDHENVPWLFREKRFVARAIAEKKPVLGLGFGAQLIADVLGARVEAGDEKEMGWWPVRATDEPGSKRFGLPSEFYAFHWHQASFHIPRGAGRIARSYSCENQGFVCGDRVVGLQFHLEVTPISVDDLIHELAFQLTPGKFIQTPYEMLANAERFVSAHSVLRTLLNGLVALAP